MLRLKRSTTFESGGRARLSFPASVRRRAPERGFGWRKERRGANGCWSGAASSLLPLLPCLRNATTKNEGDAAVGALVERAARRCGGLSRCVTRRPRLREFENA
ncbi:hypothetical protein B5F40_10410 [Gordonibacter sp. An230]|nr:hypothetical protein B5F40_10410 [Gordonibacter sp. An230]